MVYKIRGVRNLAFYGPPDHPQSSYPFLDDGTEAADVTCKALYSKYDWLRLESTAEPEAGLELVKGV
ncbi:hypothetical protein D9756_010392 [Leucocoprinus leucothites]|uniref:Uncharacterized protein n=1 Tax=Leucocoprinus leucothites TaxID=201217 RepID=A0A8H5CSQ0_9AGAR|nr:hypothetical protein D9756_010392 [Leucoagaricus leucothites]